LGYRFKDAIKTKLRAVDFLAYATAATCLQEVVKQVSAERAAAAAGGTAAEGAGNQGGVGTNAAVAAPRANPSNALVEPETGFQAMAQDDQAYWDKYTDKFIKTYVQLIPDQKTHAELENLIKDCPLSANIRGDPMGLVLYHYDVKQSVA